MQIGRKDVVWNYTATFLQVGVALLVFPFILRAFPPEMIAIWTIFSTVTVLVNLLDFGFNPSFTRNVSYVFSGAKELKSKGFNVVEQNDSIVDFGLLKGLIGVMRFFYSRMAIILFIVLSTVGTYYIYSLLKTYSGNHYEVYMSWFILCIINSYSFYTLYYDSLLLGKGEVRRTKQIIIIGQLVYLFTAIVFIQLGLGLIAIVSAQALFIIIKRGLIYHYFYTNNIKQNLNNAIKKSQKNILKSIYPNAIKVGLTGIGAFLVQRSAIILGSLHLSLDTIASYGITIQAIGVISGISTVYYSTYQPQIAKYRIQGNDHKIKQLYLKTGMFLFITYIIGGISLFLGGEWILNVIESKTLLLNKSFIVVALLIALLESNHGVAGGILLTKNEVPYFKTALFAGGLTLLLLFIFFAYANLGIWSMILAPGIAQGCYQNWHWPTVVMKELKVNRYDIYQTWMSCYKYFNKHIYIL